MMLDPPPPHPPDDSPCDDVIELRLLRILGTDDADTPPPGKRSSWPRRRTAGSPSTGARAPKN
jgi:hypothetical protein